MITEEASDHLEVVFRRVLNSDARCPEKLRKAPKEMLELGMKISIHFLKRSQGINPSQRWKDDDLNFRMT